MSPRPMAYHCAPCPVNTNPSLGCSVACWGLTWPCSSFSINSSLVDAEYVDFHGKFERRCPRVNARWRIYALSSSKLTPRRCSAILDAILDTAASSLALRTKTLDGKLSLSESIAGEGCVSTAGDSIMTCELAPPYPKLLTDALRRACGQGFTEVGI